MRGRYSGRYKEDKYVSERELEVRKGIQNPDESDSQGKDALAKEMVLKRGVQADFDKQSRRVAKADALARERQNL